MLTKTTASAPQVDASHLLRQESAGHNGLHPLEEIEIRPREQPYVSLGTYTTENPPSGFTLHVQPALQTSAIESRITRFGTNDTYELMLYISNHSDRTVGVEVSRAY